MHSISCACAIPNFQINNAINFANIVDTEATSMHSGSTTSNSSGSYSGAPYFVQTLRNLTVKEGDPVRFDANVNANPHPKVLFSCLFRWMP